MEECKLLTIIIPAYNAEKYIEDCVESCESIDLAKDIFEIIIVDDGSNDSTPKKLCELASRFNNISVFTQENQGQSVARNLGIEKAQGRYLWFVDADDYVLNEGIKQVIDKSQDLGLEITMFLMKVFHPDGTSHISDHPYLQPNVLSTGETVLLSGYCGGSVCSTLYSRNFILNNNLRFVKGIIHQDSEFSIRAIALASRVYNIGIPLYVYSYNENSCTRSASFEKARKAVTSDIIVAGNIQTFAHKNSLSSLTTKYLERTSTSLITGVMLSLVKSKRKDKILLYEAVLKEGIIRNLYPIKGKTNSWKTTMLIPIINCEHFMKLLIRFIN